MRLPHRIDDTFSLNVEPPRLIDEAFCLRRPAENTHA